MLYQEMNTKVTTCVSREPQYSLKIRKKGLCLKPKIESISVKEKKNLLSINSYNPKKNAKGNISEDSRKNKLCKNSFDIGGLRGISLKPVNGSKIQYQFSKYGLVKSKYQSIAQKESFNKLELNLKNTEKNHFFRNEIVKLDTDEKNDRSATLTPLHIQTSSFPHPTKLEHNHKLKIEMFRKNTELISAKVAPSPSNVADLSLPLTQKKRNDEASLLPIFSNLPNYPALKMESARNFLPLLPQLANEYNTTDNSSTISAETITTVVDMRQDMSTPVHVYNKFAKDAGFDFGTPIPMLVDDDEWEILNY